MDENQKAIDKINTACAKLDQLPREFICPKCGTEFADPDPAKPYDAGILCPECPGMLKGVIHPELARGYDYTKNYDDIIKLINKQPKEVKEKLFFMELSHRFQMDSTPRELAEGLLKVLNVAY